MPNRHHRRSPTFVIFATFCVALGLVFFRAQSFADVWMIFQRLLVVTGRQTLGRLDIIVVVAASDLDSTRAWHRLPAPVMATGIGAVFLLVQSLMPSGSASLVYLQF